MKQKQIIALCAYAQAGKDTIANHLVAAHGYTKMAYAEPIYAMLIAMYAHLDLTYDQLHAMKINRERLPGCDITVRVMLQTLGTEWARRYVNKDIWTFILAQKIHVHKANLFVIPDLRFMNEFTRLKQDVKMDMTLWTVERDAAIPQLEHKSEQEIAAIVKHFADATLENNFLLSSLYKKIDDIIYTNLMG